jgi:membrane-bound serine protease (ClpP class)
VNIAGLALIGLALALFVTDLFAPTHGVLTAGGILSFLLGSLLLFDGAGRAFQLPLTMIIPATLLTAAFFVFMVGAGLRAQTLPVRVGHETLVGQATVAITPVDPQGGKIFLEGAYWNVVSATPIAAGQPVEIVAVHGLTLTVKPRN